MHKRSCSENASVVDVLTSPKNYRNLQKSTFILLFHHSEANGVIKSFLVKSEILGLLFNTLTANNEYSRSNKENLTLPIPMKLSEKIHFLLKFLLHFWNLH